MASHSNQTVKSEQMIRAYKTTQFTCIYKTTGPGCSKLTTSLVNVSLKLQKLLTFFQQKMAHFRYFKISEMRHFLLKKCEKLLHCIAKASHIFPTKNIGVFGYTVVRHLTSCRVNELVKLTVL